MSRIFVAGTDSGLALAVKSLLPKIEVLAITVDKPGQISDTDKQQIIDEAEVLLADGPILKDIIPPAKKLKWAACTWAGVENLVPKLQSCQSSSVTLTRCGGAYNSIMAEYVLGYILTKERYIVELATEQRKSNWDSISYRHYRSVTDLTIGILGLGEIGKEVARLCCCSGMKVIGVTRTPPTAESRSQNVSEYRTVHQLPDVLKTCDYICNILPSTPETKGLLAGDMFSHCKNKKSILINVGRGDITTEDSIVKAIREGWLGGAVLDVFTVEPLPKDSPLWTLPGVLITPHIAGVQISSQVAKSFVDNYHLYQENKPLKYVVDIQRGYYSSDEHIIRLNNFRLVQILRCCKQQFQVK